MSETQLRLLPAPQPLVERLGAAFFRAIPAVPGVYRLFDADNHLIYVGKAGDLHARLASYRRTHGQSRKTVRLIHTACRIEWEVCASETAARLRENALIRTHRPRFNRAGTWPKSARFVVLEALPGGFRLTVTGEPSPDNQTAATASTLPTPDSPPESPDAPAVRWNGSAPPVSPLLAPTLLPAPDVRPELFGAFRGGTAFALGALARLLWLAWHRPAGPEELPHALLAAEGLRHFEADHPEADRWTPDVRAFLAADADTLMAQLVGAVPEPVTAFGRAFVAAQFELLAEFYRRGPLRNRRLRAELAPHATALAPEQLDDFLVLARPPENVPVFRPPE